MCIHLQLRMTCRKIIPWSSGSRNTCDVCTWIGGGLLPANSCRSACVSLGGCTTAGTCHGSRSSRCRRSLRCLHLKKSLSETAPVAAFHFLKQEQKSRGVLSYYTCFLSPPEPERPLTRPVLFCHWLRTACHVIENSGWTLQQHTHTGINTHRKQEDDDQRTDSALKNPTPSPHRPVRIPSHTGVLRFRLSVQETKEDHEDDAHCTDSARKNPTPLLRHTDGNGLCTSWSMPVYPTFPAMKAFLKKKIPSRFPSRLLTALNRYLTRKNQD